MSNITEYLRKYDSYEIVSRDSMGYANWDNVYFPNDRSSVSYGDIKQDKNGKFLEVPYTTYSDYSGSTVERSNCNVFLDVFKEFLSVSMWEIYGGYGTRGVLITLELYETNEDVKETIDSLFDYPLINDDELSELESEIESESWDSWIKYDLIRELESRSIEYDEDTLQERFYQACERANEYPFFEDAVSCYVHIDKIVDNWKDED